MSTRREFLTVPRRVSPYRPAHERTGDDRELITPLPLADAQEQAARCMECGVPFCHDACPLGNLIPEWNVPARDGEWRDAFTKLDATNNFPEFTGWLCPAPCEPACVLAIGSDPVSIKEIERTTIEQAFANGWVRPRPPAHRTGATVAVVGSGPAGLAAAQQLNRAGHLVTVYEKADLPGGLLRYGIPDFKMSKTLVDRRIDLLLAEGVGFECGYDCGTDITGQELLLRHDGVVLAVGAERARDVDLPGRGLHGVHLAMDYLCGQNRRVAGRGEQPITAASRDVVIIGGGDTASDCLGDSHREGCASVQQLVIYPEPPATRADDNPWPQWPLILRHSAAHLEGGSRAFGTEVVGFHDDGSGGVDGVDVVDVERRSREGGRAALARVAGSEQRIPASIVLLAIGFAGVRGSPLYAQLGVELDARHCLPSDREPVAPVVVACGDAVTGAALVVTAIASGRRAAATCDAMLRARAAAAV